eukprot:1730738-Pyramimonas_sp.AAC.1
MVHRPLSKSRDAHQKSLRVPRNSLCWGIGLASGSPLTPLFRIAPAAGRAFHASRVRRISTRAPRDDGCRPPLCVARGACKHY